MSLTFALPFDLSLHGFPCDQVVPYQSAFKIITEHLGLFNHLCLCPPACPLLVVRLQLLVYIIIVSKVSRASGQNVDMHVRDTLASQHSILNINVHYIYRYAKNIYKEYFFILLWIFEHITYIFI